MDPNHDLLRPDFLLSSETLTHSRTKWHALLSSSHPATNLPHSCSNVKILLNKTPSVPEYPEATECARKNHLSLEGYSKWSVLPADKPSRHTCELPPFKRNLSRQVCIANSRPKTCTLSADYIRDWTGFQPLQEPVGNYLCVFVLGWSYILSARMVELRRTTTDDKVVYTNNHAQWGRLQGTEASTYLDLDIGSNDVAEVRWWAAILAEGHGWKATLTRDGKQYYPPWECHLDSSLFRLWHCAHIPPSTSVFEPPSAADAHEYLCNFAQLHDAFDQLIGAFAAAITLPSHNRFGASITLPKPINRPRLGRNTESIYTTQIPTTTELPHFMALSCTSGLVASCLLASFWEPGIPCNLASQWLTPMREAASPFIHSKNIHPIIIAMSQHRPNIASLWLGSAITGLLPRVFEVSRSFLPTVCLEAAVWTSSPQSFMDPQYHRIAPVRNIDGIDMIPREDEFRLLFITDADSQEYGNPPLSPYPPFGLVNVQSTSLGVRLHLPCDHRPEYHSWEWVCENGKGLSDFGMSYGLKLPNATSNVDILQSTSTATAITIPPVIGASLVQSSTDQEFDDSVSEIATRNLFSWTFFAEGVRAEEKVL